MAAESFIAPNASVIGNVLLYGKVSVWYGAIVRGDKSTIKIGTGSSIQDRAVLSTVSRLASGYPAEVSIGRMCIIGQGALLTSCTVGDNVSIGAGSIIGEGCVIQDDSYIAAGSVLAADTLVPKGQLWAGNPAKYFRDVSGYELDSREDKLDDIWTLAYQHSEEFLPFGTVYQIAP